MVVDSVSQRLDIFYDFVIIVLEMIHSARTKYHRYDKVGWAEK
jgi:hypothetical protein